MCGAAAGRPTAVTYVAIRPKYECNGLLDTKQTFFIASARRPAVGLWPEDCTLLVAKIVKVYSGVYSGVIISHQDHQVPDICSPAFLDKGYANL